MGLGFINIEHCSPGKSVDGRICGGNQFRSLSLSREIADWISARQHPATDLPDERITQPTE